MTPDEAFAQALAFTIQSEKGLSLDKSDPGNWTGGKVGEGELKGTKYGISAASYPELDIENLTLELAARIYRRDFWRQPGFDIVAETAPQLAVRLFDLGVNCGKRTAAKMLQRAINTVCAGFILPRRRAVWREKVNRLIGGSALRVDGLIGPVTAGVIAECPYKAALLAGLKGEAYNHYAAGKPLYRAGWLERLGS